MESQERRDTRDRLAALAHVRARLWEHHSQIEDLWAEVRRVRGIRTDEGISLPSAELAQIVSECNDALEAMIDHEAAKLVGQGGPRPAITAA